MAVLSAQLTLGLRLKDDATFGNFYAGPNQEIVTLLQAAASGEGETRFYLSGTRGQGCTHLLQACCNLAQKNHISSIYLPLRNWLTRSDAQPVITPDILLGVESVQMVCLDDLQVVVGNPAWEEAIFHLYNRVQDTGGRIVTAANDLPKRIGLSLMDLVSRLSGGIIYPLKPLSDEEKIDILKMRANRRGIHLSNEVGRYMLNHCPRHMSTLLAALEALDHASLAAQRRLTIPFVKEVLQI